MRLHHLRHTHAVLLPWQILLVRFCSHKGCLACASPSIQQIHVCLSPRSFKRTKTKGPRNNSAHSSLIRLHLVPKYPRSERKSSARVPPPPGRLPQARLGFVFPRSRVSHVPARVHDVRRVTGSSQRPAEGQVEHRPAAFSIFRGEGALPGLTFLGLAANWKDPSIAVPFKQKLNRNTTGPERWPGSRSKWAIAKGGKGQKPLNLQTAWRCSR